MEKERSMLSDARLGQKLREKVMDTTCYLVNQSPTLELIEKIVHEVWTGKKPYQKVFVCDTYVHVPKEKRSKFANKVEKRIFLVMKMVLKVLNFVIQ